MYCSNKQKLFGVPNNSFKLFIYLKNFFPIPFIYYFIEVHLHTMLFIQLKCLTPWFLVYVQHHHSRFQNIFITSNNCLLTFVFTPYSPSPSPKQPLLYFLYIQISLFWTFSMNRMRSFVIDFFMQQNVLKVHPYWSIFQNFIHDRLIFHFMTILHFLKILFIWLCQVLVVACRIFSCSVWDLVP